MELATAIRQRIIKLSSEQKMKLNALSTKAGLTQSTISSFMNGDSNDPRISTILHICEGLKISLSEFFDDNLFDEVISEKVEKDDLELKI